MSARHLPWRTRLTQRRALRGAAATSLIGLAWFALAGSASSADPSASAGPSLDSPAGPTMAPPDAAGSPAPSTDVGTPTGSAAPTPAWTPNFSPSASESLSPLFIPTMPPPTPIPATAPPVPSPIAHPSNGDQNSCYDCHSAVNDKEAAIAADWKSSVHASVGVTCADCHGGDPTSDQITVAMDPNRGVRGHTDAGADGGPVRQLPRGPGPHEAVQPRDRPVRQVLDQRPRPAAAREQRHSGRDLRGLPRRPRHQEDHRPHGQGVPAQRPGPVLELPLGRGPDGAVWHPHRPVRGVRQERPRRGAAREQGHPRADVRQLPRLARRPAAHLGHGGRGLRQVPHRHPEAVRGEPPRAAPRCRATVLDVPRLARRHAADLGAVLPPADARTTRGSPATTSRPTSCAWRSPGSRTTPTGDATRATTPIRTSTRRRWASARPSMGQRPPTTLPTRRSSRRRGWG